MLPEPSMPRKPECLRFGDTIGIITPASAPPEPSRIDRAAEFIEKMGFKAKLAPHVRRRWGFLAGTDQERASDLMAMFSDSKVKAVLCFRGGYGTARLLPLLDFEIIRANPKIFVGYSDITSLHCAFLRKAGLVSFHGPMLNSDFLNERLPDFTRDSFLRTLMNPAPAGSICRGYRNKTVKILHPGTASGPLIGGNICLLCASLGTPYQPSFKRAILFFEDLDEPPYRFDRMLTQLLNAGLLQQVAGIAIGINKNCRDPKARKCKGYRQTLDDVFRERLLPLKVPIISGLPFGHVPYNATLPIGLKVTLDAQKGDLVVNEPAVLNGRS